MSADDILSQPPPDERFAYGADPKQFLEVRLPRTKGPHSVLLNIHGGYWRAKYDLAHAGHLCEALRAASVATFNTEYRRVGNAGDGWPGTFEDIRSAYRFVQQEHSRFHLDLGRLVVMGHSGRAACAVFGGARNLAPSRHFARRSRRSKEGLRATSKPGRRCGVSGRQAGRGAGKHYREADPMELSIPQARQWLLHGREDDTVPPEFSLVRTLASGHAR